jgi:ribosomal protein S8
MVERVVDQQKESWLKLVALTVIGLALAAGISAFKCISYVTQVQLCAAREARLWQDYQEESVRKDNYGMYRDILAHLKLPEVKVAKGQKTQAGRIKEYEDEMGRLNQERDQIKKEARTLALQAEKLQKKAGELGLAVILLQVGIMSTASAALTRKKILWLAGLGLGGWGLIYTVMGFMF